jgi:hypothetical protein
MSEVSIKLEINQLLENMLVEDLQSVLKYLKKKKKRKVTNKVKEIDPIVYYDRLVAEKSEVLKKLAQ